MMISAGEQCVFHVDPGSCLRGTMAVFKTTDKRFGMEEKNEHSY